MWSATIHRCPGGMSFPSNHVRCHEGPGGLVPQFSISCSRGFLDLDRGRKWHTFYNYNMPAACLITHQLIVGRVVDDIQNTSLPGDSLHNGPDLSARSLGQSSITPSNSVTANVMRLTDVWSLLIGADTMPLLPTSEPQEKLPASSRKARNLKFPPRTRTLLTVTLDDSFVFAG